LHIVLNFLSSVRLFISPKSISESLPSSNRERDEADAGRLIRRHGGARIDCGDGRRLRGHTGDVRGGSHQHGKQARRRRFLQLFRRRFRRLRHQLI